MIEDQLNRRFISMLKGTPQQQQNHTVSLLSAQDFRFLTIDQVSLALMKQRLNNDPRLTELIIPKNFGPGCRRPMPGLGYLEALVDQNTTTYTTGIEKMTEKGFIDPDGNEVEVDLFILATGLSIQSNVAASSTLNRTQHIFQAKVSDYSSWARSF
jgi:cation diffusion facilitator CzcD-associated flavoprotein CzcO